MNCQIDENSLRCVECGAVFRSTRTICTCPGRPPHGLGDIVKAGLSAIGITEERVSKAIGRPCGCGDRQATLNSLGAKHLGLPEGSTAQNTDSTTPDSP